MLALQQNFNDMSGAEEQAALELVVNDPAVNDAVYNPNILDTLGERALVGSEVDYASLQVGDTGSEAHLSVLGDMATVSSGEFGKMSAIEKDVDQSVKARMGDRSFNLSDQAQVRHENLVQGADELNYDIPEMPNVYDLDDMQLAIAAAYEQLEMAGISASDLNAAMAAGGPDNDFETLSALFDIAQDNKVEHVTDYIQGVDQAFVQVQLDQGIENVVPALDTTMPEFAMNDPRFDVPEPEVDSQYGGPSFGAGGMGMR
ncbi:MAG: hypothetical protein ACRBCK_12020 [Alphaproteobacteria bacterium]